MSTFIKVSADSVPTTSRSASYDVSGSIEYNNNPAIFQDQDQGIKDPNNLEQGWYYTNNVSGDKINWYFILSTNTKYQFSKGQLQNGYCLMKVLKGGSLHFSVYSQRENDGNDGGSWYRSRWTYITGDLTPFIGQIVLLYFGKEPEVFPNFPRVECPLSSSTHNNVGPLQDNELIQTAALSTGTTDPAQSIEFIAKVLGSEVKLSSTSNVDRDNLLLVAE